MQVDHAPSACGKENESSGRILAALWKSAKETAGQPHISIILQVEVLKDFEDVT